MDRRAASAAPPDGHRHGSEDLPYLERAGETHELRPGENLIGCGSQASWRIANADLMARHIVVDLEGEVVMVRPDSPQCVVLVNGIQVPMTGVLLGEGDRMAAGRAAFTFFRDPAHPPAPTVPPQPPPAFLVFDEGNACWALRTRSLTVGRDVANAVVMDEPAVSRFHAEVRSEAGEHVLHASAGTTGTSLNGVRITVPHVLCEGDLIGVGETVLRYHRGRAPAGFVVRTSIMAPEPSRAALERQLAPTGLMMALPAPTGRRYGPYVAGAAAALGAATMYLLMR